MDLDMVITQQQIKDSDGADFGISRICITGIAKTQVETCPKKRYEESQC